MMSDCCHGKQQELEKTATQHRHILWIVLIINLLMFGVELSFGLLASSLALVGDSLDMLGDAITYGSSIAVVGMSVRRKAGVAKLKAWIMLTFGLIISGRCIYEAVYPTVPDFDLMFGIGGLALAMNLICLFLLTKVRNDDINMRSVWICSRNDIIANSSVLVAAVGVYFTHSAIPDLLVGGGLTLLFTKSALGIFKDVNETLEKELLSTNG